MTDDLLLEDLTANPEPSVEVVATKDLPPWATRWVGELGPDITLVHVSVPGNGDAFHFILLTTSGGVGGLWKETTFESN